MFSLFGVMIDSEKVIYTAQANSKIQKILEWWTEKLQVIADFDKTLTYWNQPSIIAVLYNYNYLSEDYSKKAKELENFYMPKEEDRSIPFEERKLLMRQWWVKHEQLLIESWLSKKHIENVVNSWILKLREWCHDMLDQLDLLWIPVIILSASGLWTDSIAIYLHEHLDKHQKLYIISNEYIWDENWFAVGRNEPVITSLNKNETVISEKSFPKIYHEIELRKNIILLWDKIEDLDMAEGVNPEVVLKIGFLNSWSDENLEFYKKYFDIVISWELGLQEIQKIISWFD